MRNSLAALLALAAAGCADEDAPRCTRDRDCTGGRICVPEAGICVRMTEPLEPPDAAPPEDGMDAPAD